MKFTRTKHDAAMLLSPELMKALHEGGKWCYFCDGLRVEDHTCKCWLCCEPMITCRCLAKDHPIKLDRWKSIYGLANDQSGESETSKEEFLDS